MPLSQKTLERPLLLSKLVAHRGDQEIFIENTLAAFQQAFEAGAEFAECDIQLTKDLIPVVFHDDNLKRLCLRGESISALTWSNIQTLEISFQIPKLSELLGWLGQNPKITLFIEIKPDVLKRFSGDEVASFLFGAVAPNLISQIVLISESVQILEACVVKLGCAIGWVAEGDDKPSSLLIQKMDYIFMSVDDAGQIKSWQKKGVKVGIYTINDATKAYEILDMGADLIETNHFSRLLRQMVGEDAKS